eukprot:9225292-Pyramimonas_sp.AAC.1
MRERRCGHGAAMGRIRMHPWLQPGTFPRLAFRAWGEARSAQKLLANSIAEEDSEIAISDMQLVAGKQPSSLAKFQTAPGAFHAA